MRVLVTGGSGKLGRAVLADLVAHGHSVLNVDLVPPEVELCPFVRVDLGDFGQVFEAIDGIDLAQQSEAVVHLAAIASPGRASNATTFRDNLVGTYNVFEACRRSRVRNVVYASTEIIYGLPFDTAPDSLPVDEGSPARPESAYGLAKLLAEEMARQFARWDPEAKLVGLRFSNIQDEADYARFPGFEADPYERRWNLWGYVDARDAAQGVRKALEVPIRGADVFTIAAAETTQRTANDDLVQHCFPGISPRGGLGRNDTLLSIEKARRVLGYEPEHHWWSEPGAS